MPDYREVDTKRELASVFLSSMAKMDLGEIESRGISIEAGVGKIGLEAITFLWQENIMKDRKSRGAFMDHIDEYPHGFLAQTVRHVMNSWVSMGRVERKQALKDFGLLE
ncbi:hypothetical protein KBD75_01290 [Candidatus Woesebacteria bacterium]|nr:hypothetical protein [Candidatus Woesebacteria bacterium]